MQGPFSKIVMSVGAAAALATSAIPKPAAADTTSTMNTLLGAAAVIGGLVIYNNVQHKNAQANQVVGYTRNGGTMYADGRIVMPNGQTYYPNSNGQSSINQYGYNNGYNPNTYGYSTNQNGYSNNGRYNGQYANNNGSYYNLPKNAQNGSGYGRWNGRNQNNDGQNANRGNGNGGNAGRDRGNNSGR